MAASTEYPNSSAEEDFDRRVELVNLLHELEAELDGMAGYEQEYAEHYQTVRDDRNAAASEYWELTGSEWTGEDEEVEELNENEESYDDSEYGDEPNQSTPDDDPSQSSGPKPVCDQNWWEGSKDLEAPTAGLGESVCLAPEPPNLEQGVLAIHIIDSKGKPIENVDVEIEGPASFRQTTDEGGAIFFPSVPTGEYEITCFTAGGNSAVGAVTAYTSKSNSVEIVLERDSRVLQFGIFFDGTGNNFAVDRQREGDEYEPTNVAKLSELYPVDPSNGIYAHYINGVGTKDGALASGKKADYSDLEMAFGAGIAERMHRARASLQRFVKDMHRSGTSTVIQLDLFGFSRGAATARFFVNYLLRVRLRGQTIRRFPSFFPEGVELEIRFVGLYDTVGSVGLPGDERNWEYDITLRSEDVGAVQHLTALHEQRENFPLTSVFSGAGATRPSTFTEELLPGVHSDIGGGYGPVPKERIYMHREKFSWLDVERPASIRTQVEQLRAEWAEQMRDRGGQVIVEEAGPQTQNPRQRQRSQDFYVVWVREVKIDLAFFALERMHQGARQHGVPLKPLAALKNLPYQISDELRSLYGKFSTDPAARAALERDYVHHSHQPVHPPDRFFHGNVPEKNPFHRAPNGRREVFFNDPAGR